MESVEENPQRLMQQDATCSNHVGFENLHGFCEKEVSVFTVQAYQ